MRISKLIAYSAFSLIAAFLVVSSASIYVSTAETAQALSGNVKYVNLSAPQPYVGVCLNGQAKGIVPSSITILNQTITLNPGQTISKMLRVPLNIGNLSKKGFPFESFSMVISDAISGILSVLNITSYRGGLTLNMPAIISNISSPKMSQENNSPGKALLSVGLRFLIPIFFDGAKMLVYSGSQIIGNMSIGSSGGINPGNYNLTGLINIPKGQTITETLQNLSFSIGGLKW